ncbi:MAG: FtsB family cell division protein [Rhodospirillales bacterium]
MPSGPVPSGQSIPPSNRERDRLGALAGQLLSAAPPTEQIFRSGRLAADHLAADRLATDHLAAETGERAGGFNPDAVETSARFGGQPFLRALGQRLGQAVWPLIGVLLAVYFTLHGIQGERGLLAKARLERQVAKTAAEAAELESRRLAWEAKVHLLRPDSLDPDLLDERSRIMNNLAGPEDLVILLPGEGRKP